MCKILIFNISTCLVVHSIIFPCNCCFLGCSIVRIHTYAVEHLITKYQVSHLGIAQPNPAFLDHCVLIKRYARFDASTNRNEDNESLDSVQNILSENTQQKEYKEGGRAFNDRVSVSRRHTTFFCYPYEKSLNPSYIFRNNKAYCVSI